VHGKIILRGALLSFRQKIRAAFFRRNTAYRPPNRLNPG